MVTLKWFNTPIRTRAIIGKPPYNIIIVEAGMSFTDMTIVINRNRSFQIVFRDLIHEFGHIILYHLRQEQCSPLHKIWDFIAVPRAFFEQWDLWKVWYDKDG